MGDNGDSGMPEVSVEPYGDGSNLYVRYSMDEYCSLQGGGRGSMRNSAKMYASSDVESANEKQHH